MKLVWITTVHLALTLSCRSPDRNDDRRTDLGGRANEEVHCRLIVAQFEAFWEGFSASGALSASTGTSTNMQQSRILRLQSQCRQLGVQRRRFRSSAPSTLSGRSPPLLQPIPHSFRRSRLHMSSQPLSTMPSLLEDDEEEYYAAVEEHTNYWVSELLPRFQPEVSSLDLELGENWKDQRDLWERQQVVEEEEPQSVEPANKSFIEGFDPMNPPKDNLQQLQWWLECQAQHSAVLKYQSILDDARDRKDYGSMPVVQQQILNWFQPLKDEISTLQREYIVRAPGEKSRQSAKVYGPLLCVLPAEKVAVVASHAALMHLLMKGGSSGQGGIPFTSLAKVIGEAIEEEVVIHRTLHQRYQDARQGKDATSATKDPTEDAIMEMLDHSDSEVDSKELEDIKPLKWMYAPSHLRNYLEDVSRTEPTLKRRRLINYALKRARRTLDHDREWTEAEKVQLGAALFQVLLNTAVVRDGENDEMAFSYEKRWFKKERLQAYVSLNERLYDMIVSDKMETLVPIAARHRPMVVPPQPWTSSENGGYAFLKAELMRYHGSSYQREAMLNAELSTLFNGLNALGRVPWRINKRVLNVAQKCWDDNISLGDIPSRTDHDLPREPVPPPKPTKKLDKDSPAYAAFMEETRTYREALKRYRRIVQKNMDLRSLRCSVLLKLGQAEEYKDYEEIFFPYNVDFRGRAYPIPPHLSNVGSDLCRGMLQFKESKPLGPRGLYWLKVHLANFAGADKMSFDDRARFVDERMHLVRESAEDPFAGERWWMTLDDPFQGLAACFEIINAIDSGDPESYDCALSVHVRHAVVSCISIDDPHLSLTDGWLLQRIATLRGARTRQDWWKGGKPVQLWRTTRCIYWCHARGDPSRGR